MRYSLWSHDCLVGYTDLDIPCVTDYLCQGFLEPTPQSGPALLDATGVARICAIRPECPSGSRAEKAYLAEFMRACRRREALNFVLRDESGEEFEFDFIRIWDLRDDPCERRPRETQKVEDEEMDADLFAEFEEELMLDEESRQYGSTWPPRDDRWDTMPYLIQVYLRRPEWHDADDLLF